MTQVTFTNHEGLSLTGNLELPEQQPPRAYALFAHCFSCTRKVRAAVHIARAMAAQGIAVLRFDFTGLGDSDGEFTDSSFSANVDDLLSAAEWLAAEYQPIQILVGHSLGGTATLAAAAQIESCRAVATINAPSRPEHVLHHMQDQLDQIKQQGSATVNLGGRPFRINRAFVEDIRSQDIADNLKHLKPALLVLHSPVDKTVSIDNAEAIYSAVRHPKSFISLDQADHLLSDPDDSNYAGRMIANWAERYLDDEPEQADASTSQTAAPPGVTVSGRTDQGFYCTVNSGSHQWVADEPADVGTDRGPDPYAHLAAALASCTVMTLNMYARHKKLDVEQVTTNVQHQRIHASDCDDCEHTDGKIDVLTRRISINGGLDDEHRQRMLEIADKCPVHRTLENEIKVRTSLDEPESNELST